MSWHVHGQALNSASTSVQLEGVAPHVTARLYHREAYLYYK